MTLSTRVRTVVLSPPFEGTVSVRMTRAHMRALRDVATADVGDPQFKRRFAWTMATWCAASDVHAEDGATFDLTTTAGWLAAPVDLYDQVIAAVRDAERRGREN